MRIDDPVHVRQQYASEAGLAAREAVYKEVTGPDAQELLFDAVAEVSPSRILEVGCEPLLSRYFARVERRDADGTVTFTDADAIRSYLRSSDRLASFAGEVPELTEPLVARRRPVVVVAEKAA